MACDNSQSGLAGPAGESYKLACFVGLLDEDMTNVSWSGSPGCDKGGGRSPLCGRLLDLVPFTDGYKSSSLSEAVGEEAPSPMSLRSLLGDRGGRWGKCCAMAPNEILPETFRLPAGLPEVVGDGMCPI